MPMIIANDTQPVISINSFSTRRLFSCTDEYAHTYDISTYWV